MTAWSDIVVAAIGSEAVGGGVGSYLPTRLRGEIERDEAWRTRLFEASDDFVGQLGRAISSVPYNWLLAIESDEQSLQSDEESMLRTASVISAFADERAKLPPLMARIELLYGDQALKLAELAVRNLDNAAAAVLTRKTWIVNEIDEHGSERLDFLEPRQVKADDKDVDDDQATAYWIRLLLESAAGHRQRFVRICSDRITSRRPSRLD